MMENDRAHALRQAINCCRKAGIVSIPGVYSGLVDKLPMGTAMNKGLTFKMGQTHMHRYLKPLLERVQKGEIDPSFVITHTVPLEDAPKMYSVFQKKQDKCVKVVLKPGM
jgi:threonine dehydrogenase-like Zn-dependent dehydrogenase